jgi:hypothetical protein
METWHLDALLRRVVLHLVSPLTLSSPIPIDALVDEYSMLIETQQSISEDSLLFGFSLPTGPACKNGTYRPSAYHARFKKPAEPFDC